MPSRILLKNLPGRPNVPKLAVNLTLWDAKKPNPTMLSQVKGGLSVERDLNLGKAKVSWVGSVLVLTSRTRFSKVPITFRARKAVYVYRVCIQDQSFNNFENEFDTIKLSANEVKLTGLCARKRATIQQVLILKVAFGPEKLPGLSRNGRLYR